MEALYRAIIFMRHSQVLSTSAAEAKPKEALFFIKNIKKIQNLEDLLEPTSFMI